MAHLWALVELFKVYAGSVAFLGLKAEQVEALSRLICLKGENHINVVDLCLGCKLKINLVQYFLINHRCNSILAVVYFYDCDKELLWV